MLTDTWHIWQRIFYDVSETSGKTLTLTGKHLVADHNHQKQLKADFVVDQRTKVKRAEFKYLKEMDKIMK